MHNIIYRLVNRRKEKSGDTPCYYIGSKFNYVPGQYWGSSQHPILISELKDNITDFELEILAVVDSPEVLTITEREYQEKFNVLENDQYYNLCLANVKFSSLGWKWYHNPLTLQRGFFPKNKIPKNWVIGKIPKKTPKIYSSNSLSCAEKISETLKGRKKDRKSVEQGMQTKRNKLAKFDVYSDDIIFEKEINLKDFAEKYNFNYISLYEIVRKGKKYKGYVFQKKG